MAAEYTVNVPAPQSPTISYLTTDALGSVRVISNSFGEIKARRDFLPFGEEIYAGIGSRTTAQKYSANGDDTRKKFATYQRDIETGLDFAQSRYYSPMQGRFTSPDEFKGGPDELFDFEDDASSNPTFYADLKNPQSLNKYQYGYNNPYKFNDPNGHCPEGCLAQVMLGPTVVETIGTYVRPFVESARTIAETSGRIIKTTGTVVRGATSTSGTSDILFPTYRPFNPTQAQVFPRPTTVAQPRVTQPQARPQPIEMGKRARKRGRTVSTQQPKTKTQQQPQKPEKVHTKGARKSTHNRHTNRRSGQSQPPNFGKNKPKRPQDMPPKPKKPENN